MIESTKAGIGPWRERLAALRSEDPALAAFIANALRSADEQDLSLYDPATLEALLRRTYGEIGTRTPGRAGIRIWSPEPDLLAGMTIIDIHSADTPFIVDSALAAVRAAGGAIRFMTHPVVPLDTTTTPWRVLEAPSEASRNESILQVHIDTPPDPETLEAIRAELTGAMAQVRAAVLDWREMLERLRTVVVSYRNHPPLMRETALTEAVHFLAWLADHNFTFLGMREYRLTGDEGGTRTLVPVEGTGLGILRDPNYLYLREGSTYVHMNAQHLAFLATDEPLMVTKANRRSLVHRRVHMDYVGIKTFDATGAITGELRILGLFTSASLAVPATEVPLIRRKIAEVIRRTGLDPRSHAGKALTTTLESYPRDELFQITVDELAEFAPVISTLPDRPRVRVLPRIDRFDNFVSILVYLPRDRYDSDVRARIGEHLAARYDGRVSAFTPDFPEGDLARVHFIISRHGGPTPHPGREALEAEILELTRSFADRLLSAAPRPATIADYAQAFSADYQIAHSHADALDDIAIFKTLGPETPLAVRLVHGETGDQSLTLNVYHRADPIPLSARVPMLEHFGFQVVDERTYTIRPQGPQPRFLHAMALKTAGAPLDLAQSARRIEEAILAVSNGLAENDGYNRLIAVAGLSWADAALLRALGRYLKQIRIGLSQAYIWTTLAAHPAIARDLVELFHTLHDPHLDADRTEAAEALQASIATALEAITSIDEDRIVRRLLNLIEASLRTNLYRRVEGKPRPALAIKFDATRIDGLPQPRPWREIYVYSPRVEGVHMRGGPIARGGLRWSDRPEDFRTEILGLVKAQMVKNAVIVPVGAKGGFVPRLMPANPDRDTMMAEGTACYTIFISALLDVTDNLVGDTVLPPEMVFRRDSDDPYLVVAADKGTASFSDTANAIATAHDYWLGDAFASGGSAGYDHKKMGITACGAWEAVKRHFREINIDIQTQDFTVAGVGDMSGDVFGNGMLLSPRIRLVAAFDHRDIFIDPNPDVGKSFAERRRLFALPRSSWQDYDTALISEGGGVFSRSAKSIPLSPAMRSLLGLSAERAAPAEIISAILGAEVDLLWFGGIGTYIRASDETDAEVGDRANDAIRVAGSAVRAKVVGEGANLGVTQRGRVEYALAGGRINTDAIDNSGGVNSSDLEVNIKIALSGLLRSGALDIDARNAFLAEMTGEVADLCLRNNYLQPLALSLAQRRGMADFPDLVDLIEGLEADGELDRAVEFLPDDATLAERAASGAALTRPELAVLLAYAKLSLYADLLASPAIDDPYLARELFRYFPAALEARFPEAIESHRLRREIIATVLSNAMINRGGPAFAARLAAITAAEPGVIALAYASARDSFDIQNLNAAIDALDTQIAGETQLALYAEIQSLQVDMALWFLRNEEVTEGLSSLVERYRIGVAGIAAALPDLLPSALAGATARREADFTAAGVPPDLARRIAALPALSLAPDAVLVATRCKAETGDAARAMFAVIEMFGLGRLVGEGATIKAADRFDRMAIDRALANLSRALRDLTADILVAGEGPVESRIQDWKAPRETAIARLAGSVSDLIDGDLTPSRLSVAAGLLSDLAHS